MQLDEITDSLSRHSADLKEGNDRGHAAVAMILRQGGAAPEALFIIRAEHDADPWSGNIGFPGGRLDGSETPQQAAERETREELGLDLSDARPLGRLDDLYGAIMPVLVSCFVYRLDRCVTLQPNHEIAETFWYPLPELLDPARHTEQSFAYRGTQRTHPVVDLRDGRQPLLWGITYRLTANFFAICGYDFGPGTPSSATRI